MLTIVAHRLTDAERAMQQRIVALDEDEASLRRRRMVVSAQFFGVATLGIAVSVLTYNLWTGGPAQVAAVLPQTLVAALMFFVVFTLLSGRRAGRDFAALQGLKQQAERALAADRAQTATLTLDAGTFVIRHPEVGFVVTGGRPSGSAILDLSADADLAAMFAQPTPPLGVISWVHNPETGAVSHPLQQGLPPAALDRLDVPGSVPEAAIRTALGIEQGATIGQSDADPAALRRRIEALSESP